jgi:hypothetical protein
LDGFFGGEKTKLFLALIFSGAGFGAGRTSIFAKRSQFPVSAGDGAELDGFSAKWLFEKTNPFCWQEGIDYRSGVYTRVFGLEG